MRLDNLAMSSLVLGGAVGAVGDSTSPMLSSPSSPTTSFTWATKLKWSWASRISRFVRCFDFIDLYLFWLHETDDIIRPVANLKDGIEPGKCEDIINGTELTKNVKNPTKKSS